MKTMNRAAAALCALLLTTCGGGGGGGLTLKGPFLIDFEQLALSNDPEPQPVALGLGVEATSPGTLYISDTWFLGGCMGVATSGTKFFGMSETLDTFRVDFDQRVATIEFQMAADAGTSATIEVLDRFDAVIDTIQVTETPCPVFMRQIESGLGASTNAISAFRITGSDVIIDDLRFWRFE